MEIQTDRIIRATILDSQARIFLAITTKTVQEARTKHGTSPVATAALGRVLTATALISSTMKNDEDVTIRVMGDGPLGAIVATGDTTINVRGYVGNPLLDLPLNANGKLDVGGAVGKNGFLHVTKDLKMNEPYTSSIPLDTGEIGDDFMHYFYESDQLPSALALGVLVDTNCDVKVSGGYLLQTLPDAKEDVAVYLEDRIQTNPSFTSMLSSISDPRELLIEITGDSNVKILEEKPVAFRCKCNRNRILDAFALLNPTEVEQMLDANREVEAVCHFCNEKYKFTENELIDLLKHAKETIV